MVYFKDAWLPTLLHIAVTRGGMASFSPDPIVPFLIENEGPVTGNERLAQDPVASHHPSSLPTCHLL